MSQPLISCAGSNRNGSCTYAARADGETVDVRTERPSRWRVAFPAVYTTDSDRAAAVITKARKRRVQVRFAIGVLEGMSAQRQDQRQQTFARRRREMVDRPQGVAGNWQIEAVGSMTKAAPRVQIRSAGHPNTFATIAD